MFNFKTLQSKISLIFGFILLALIIVTYTNFSVHKRHYDDFLNFSVKNTIANIKLNVNNVEIMKSKILKYKYHDFQKINKFVQTFLQKNPNVDLKKVQKLVFDNFNVSSDIYLINKNYTIYKTTDIQDLNLSMLNFMGAKEYIDKSLVENTTLIANSSYDILTKKYITYSYMPLDREKGITLEIGIENKLISEIVDNFYDFNMDNSIVHNLELFADFGKYIVNFTKDDINKLISKQEYLTRKTIQEDEEITIVKKVCKKKKEYRYTVYDKNKTYIIIYTYLSSKHISLSKVKNYILKTKIDVSQFEKDIYELKLMFYLTLIFSTVVIIIFYSFLTYSFILPMRKILEHTKAWKKITSKRILSKEDELSELAQSFNATYERQKELNNTLETKIEDAVNDIKQKEKLLQSQSRLAQIGELLGMIAHQWRQPLGAIASAIIGLKLHLNIKEKEYNNNQKEIEYLEYVDGKYDAINEYVQFLSTTIDDFKNFYKPDKLKEKYTLNVPITQALKIVQSSLDLHEIELDLRLKAEDKIDLYKNELMQVILNIIKNAEDNFIEKSIINPRIIIETICQLNVYKIQISDNGGGIKKEILDNIFNPYFSTKEENNGTGLGLYMSKIMIEDHHGGKLNVYNTSDGVCFEIIFFT